jgi:hypothetical protein
VKYIDPTGLDYCESNYADPTDCAKADPDGDGKIGLPWNENLLRDDTPNGSPDSVGGLDYGINEGSNVYSSSVGTVDIADSCDLANCIYDGEQDNWKNNRGYGSLVIIEYQAQYLPSAYRVELGIGVDQSFYVAYTHLSEIYVHIGDSVIANQVIGLSGDTGNSTGPHLHAEVRIGRSGAIRPGRFTSETGYYGSGNRSRDWFNLTKKDPDILFPGPPK